MAWSKPSTWFKKPVQSPPTRSRQPGRRQYKAAETDNLVARWSTHSRAIDADLKVALPILRARARDLEQNNDYAAKFISMVGNNVVGNVGPKFQSLADMDNGAPDENARRLIEFAWRKWSKKGICTVDGRLSLQNAGKLFIETVARDGEVLIRYVKGRAAGNKFGFALQFLESDYLDIGHNRSLKNGNLIKMSVEMNSWGRPVAYHVSKFNPMTDHFERIGTEYTRISAQDMNHSFLVKRPEQTRGVPWLAPAMWRLNMLGGYEEAELVASRASAAKMGFYVTPDGGGDGIGNDMDAQGEYIMDAEAGVMGILPEGTDFKSFDPQHPTSQFGAFSKLILRGIAAGLGVSYNALANDLEGVNYSSIRQGAIDERDMWRTLQTWAIDNFYDPVFQMWLPLAISNGQLNLPPRKMYKWMHSTFHPRGWQWVDPLKEAKGNIAQIDEGLKSHTQVLAEQGREYEEVLKQLAAEQKLADKYGIIKPSLQKGMNNGNNPNP